MILDQSRQLQRLWIWTRVKTEKRRLKKLTRSRSREDRAWWIAYSDYKICNELQSWVNLQTRGTARWYYSMTSKKKDHQNRAQHPRAKAASIQRRLKASSLTSQVRNQVQMERQIKTAHWKERKANDFDSNTRKYTRGQSTSRQGHPWHNFDMVGNLSP